MAIGKNKRITKGKKGGKKKVGDPFSRKEWYRCKAPSIFRQRIFGQTCVTRSSGKKLSVDGLRGRTYVVNLADLLEKEEDKASINIKFVCEEVVGKTCYCDFNGMAMTRDSLCSLMRKWHTLIEANVTATTEDGFTLRAFVKTFSRRREGQVKSTCYVGASQIRMIRQKICDFMRGQIEKQKMTDFVKSVMSQNMGSVMERECASIYPLKNTCIAKVKVISKPKLDAARLIDDQDEPEAPADVDAPKNVLTAEIEDTPEA